MTPAQGGVQVAPAGGVTASRSTAAEICADLRKGEFLDQSFDRRTAELDARDRRWLRELVHGMLRNRGRIDGMLADLVRGGVARIDADLLDLLRLGVYQLQHMGSVPAYAAIAQTVELAKRRHGIGASKLVNAVLRRVDRENPSGPLTLPDDPAERLAVEQSHPAWLVARWIERWGIRATEDLLKRNNSEAPIVVRPHGIVREQLEAMLESADVAIGDAPLAGDSIQISGPVSLSQLGAYRQGLFFVQDPAATLVTRFAAFPENATIADLCAAPGGKALELTRRSGCVIASDRSFARLQRLAQNRSRLDAQLQILTADARMPAIRPVDAVLIDVPCTGTGTFRRHPDARWRLRVSDFSVMAQLQAGILRGAATAVKAGGLLVYSTCSLEPEENEAQVERFLRDNADWKLEAPPAGAVQSEVIDGPYLRVLPHVHLTDGAFAARLRRTA